MLVFVCAQSMADQIMTNMSLSFTPAVNETTCEFSAYDQYNTFRYSKTGNVRDVGGCVVSYKNSQLGHPPVKNPLKDLSVCLATDLILKRYM